MIKGENNNSIQPVLNPEDEFRETVNAAVGAVVGSYISFEMTQSKIPETQRKEYAAKRLPVYIDGLKRGEEAVIRSIADQSLSFPVLNGSAQRIYTFDKQGEITWTVEPISTDIANRLRFFKQAESESVETSGKSTIWTDPFLISQALEHGFNRQQQIYAEFSRLRVQVRDSKNKYKSTIGFLPSTKAQFDHFAAEIEALKAVQKREDRPEQDVFTENYTARSHPFLDLLPIVSQTILDIQKLDDLFPDQTSALINLENVMQPNRRRPTESEKQTQIRTLAVNLLVDPDNIATINDIGAPRANLVEVIRVNEFFRKLREKYSGNKLARMQYMIAHRLFSQYTPKLQELLKQSGFPPDLGVEFLQNYILSEFKKMPYPPSLITTEKNKSTISSSNFDLASRYYHLNYENFIDDSVETVVEKIWNGRTDFNEITKILYSLNTGSNANKRRSFIRTLLSYKPDKNTTVTFDTVLSFIADYYRLGYDPQNKIITCVKLKEDEYVPRMRRESKVFLEESLAEVSSSNQRLLRFIQRLMLQSTAPVFLESKGIPGSEFHISYDVRDLLKGAGDRDRLLKLTTAYVLANITAKDFMKSFPNFDMANTVKVKRHASRLVGQMYTPEIREQNRKMWNYVKAKTPELLLNLLPELYEFSFTNKPDEFVIEMLQRSIKTIPKIHASRN